MAMRENLPAEVPASKWGERCRYREIGLCVGGIFISGNKDLRTQGLKGGGARWLPRVVDSLCPPQVIVPHHYTVDR